MKQFDLYRFGRALKCQILVTRKAWLRLFGIFTMVMFFAGLFFTRIAGPSYLSMEQWYDGESLIHYYSGFVKDSAIFGIFFFFFAMLFGASSLFMNMKDTRKRSAYMLWPVSNGEKFVISLLQAIFLIAIIAVAAYAVADALRVLVDAVTGRVIVWGLPIYVEHISDKFGQLRWQDTMQMLTWMFYFHSLYIVGGTLFRRYHFLSTSGVIAIVTILFIMLIKQTRIDHWDYHFVDYVHEGGDFTVIYNLSFYIAIIISWLIVAFHYWLSFKFFCRMQVINNKWLNI